MVWSASEEARFSKLGNGEKIFGRGPYRLWEVARVQSETTGGVMIAHSLIVAPTGLSPR